MYDTSCSVDASTSTYWLLGYSSFRASSSIDTCLKEQWTIGISNDSDCQLVQFGLDIINLMIELVVIQCYKEDTFKDING